MNKKQIFVFQIVIVMCLLLSAMPVTAADSSYFRSHYNSTDIPSIDQALVTDMIGIQLADELTVGVMRQNESTGRLELGMASDYKVSEDGKVYIFTLLEGVPWVRYNPDTKQVEEVKDCDGNVRTVTANDFVYGAERTLRASTASEYAYVLSGIVGAEAYSADETGTADFATVGIKALDEKTVEYTFMEPGIFNLSILSMWMVHAMPAWVIDGDACTEALGEKWTETGAYQGYGPFTLEEWVHDSHLTIIANPFWQGTEFIPKPSIAGVDIAIIDTSIALAKYEAGDLDESSVPSADYDRIMSDPKFADQIVKTSGTIGTEFSVYNINKAPTDDIRVRLALSYATDKDAIVKALKSGIAAPYFIHQGVDGAPKVADFPELGIMADKAKAKELIDTYCKEKGIAPKDVVVTYSYNTSESRKQLAELLQFMWQDTLGITVELKNSEWAVYKVERKEGLDNIYRSSWVQDYLDANNFTADVFLCGTGYSSVVDWPSVDCTVVDDPAYQEYADTVKKAGQETDPIERAKLYARTDDILINDAAVINPIYWYSSTMLRKPNIKTTESLIGYERWEKWVIEK